MTDHLSLERLNQLTQAQAEAELRACCASHRWAAALASGRPYATNTALYAAAEQAWWSLDESDWREGVAAHPRPGPPPAGGPRPPPGPGGGGGGAARELPRPCPRRPAHAGRGRPAPLRS